ncbi:MAG: DNA-processing protein DprA [Trueperaceae bacterium]
MDESDEILLKLALTPAIGSRKVARLLEAFGTTLAVWSASARDWAVEAELPPSLHLAAHSRHVALDAQRVQKSCRELNIGILSLANPSYPGALAAIYDPPPVLYVRGTLPSPRLLDRSIAIVGTRKASSHGLSFTYRLAAELSAAGAVVVSGLAAGIDAEAHRAVVESGAIGVAVLPGGLDTIHPPVNRRLGESLCGKGCLVSEHPPGTSLRRGFFVGRNRIISGLSRVVAVIEAGEKSGALITAEFATEQNRTIFVMPGRPGDPRVAGTLPLLRDGAWPLLSSVDIATELGLNFEPVTRSLLLELGDDGTLFALGGASFDAIMAKSGLSPSQLFSTLGMLELAGRIRRGPDGHYYPKTGQN